MVSLLRTTVRIDSKTDPTADMDILLPTKQTEDPASDATNPIAAVPGLSKTYPKKNHLNRSSVEVRNSTVPATITSSYSEAMALMDEKLRAARESEEGSSVPWDFTEPRRILVVTTWRSGSTFFGEILSNYSGTFYTYEPFMHYGVQQIKKAADKQRSLKLIRDLFTCRFEDKGYTKSLLRSKNYITKNNPAVWETCATVDKELCGDRSFLKESCVKFPILSMKTVRMRLSEVEALLKDDQLPNLKIIYLVRDPRAMLSSRKKLKWCTKTPDCIDPARFCSFTRMDLKSFQNLSTRFPGNLKMVQYETLASEPVKTYEEVFKFLGLKFTNYLRDLVKQKTSVHIKGIISTSRISKERIALWKNELTRDEISFVESVCYDVLKDLKLETVSIP